MKPTNPIEIPAGHILSDDPELVDVWALFQSAWDQAEASMMQLFQVVTGLDPFVTRVIVVRVKSNSIALQIISDLSGPIEHLSRPFLTTTQAKLVYGFAKELKNANETRNRLIHGQWSKWKNSADGTDEVRRVTDRPDFLEPLRVQKYNFSKEDIHAFVNDLDDLTAGVFAFTGPVLGTKFLRDMEIMKKLYGPEE